MNGYSYYNQELESEPTKEPQLAQHRSRGSSDAEMKRYFHLNDERYRQVNEPDKSNTSNMWEPATNSGAPVYTSRMGYRPIYDHQQSQACKKGVVNILSPSIERHVPGVSMHAMIAYEPDPCCMEVGNYETPYANVQKPVVYRRRLCRLSHALDISPVVYSGERILIPTKYKTFEHSLSTKNNRTSDIGSIKAVEIKRNAPVEGSRVTEDESKRAIERESVKVVEIESERAIQVESNKFMQIENKKSEVTENNQTVRVENHRIKEAESESAVNIEDERDLEIERNRRSSRIESISTRMAVPTMVQPVIIARPCLTMSKEDAACEAIMTGEGKLFSGRPRSKVRSIGTRKESEAYNARRESAQPTTCSYNSVPKVDAEANTDFPVIPIMYNDRCYRVSVSEPRPSSGGESAPSAVKSSADKIVTGQSFSADKLVVASRSSADLVVTPARSSADQLVSAHGSSIQKTSLQKPSKLPTTPKQSKTKVKLTQCPVQKCHIATQCQGRVIGEVDRNNQTVTESPSLYSNGKYISESTDMISGDSAKRNSLKESPDKKVQSQCEQENPEDFQNWDSKKMNTKMELMASQMVPEFCKKEVCKSRNCHQAKSVECQSNVKEFSSELESSSECNLKLNTPRFVESPRPTKHKPTKTADNDLASKIKFALKSEATTNAVGCENKMVAPSTTRPDHQKHSIGCMQTSEESSEESTIRENVMCQDAQTETPREMDISRWKRQRGEPAKDVSLPLRSPWRVPRTIPRSKSSAMHLTRSRTPPRSLPRHARSCSASPSSTINIKAGAGAADVAAEMTITMESYCSDAIMRRAMTASFAAVQYRESVRRRTTICTTGLDIPIGLKKLRR